MRDALPAALLLDLDGTLVDSEPIHRASYRTFFADRGWDGGDLSRFTGRRAEDVFASEPGPWSGADPLALAADVVSSMAADAAPEPLAGARRIVEAAAARGIPVAVVTSAGPVWAELSLADVLGVRELVELVVTSQDVDAGKPDPACFVLACSRLGVNPAGCVVVEDSPAGVAAAVAAGIQRVFGVSTTHSAAQLHEAGAPDVCADLSDIAARIGL